MKKNYLLIFITLCLITHVNSQEITIDPIELIGHRTDKNSVGHGVNVALYPGEKPLIFFATHKLGTIFSPVNRTVSEWFPDHVKLATVHLNTKIVEECEICVTEQDVIVAQYIITNNYHKPQTYIINISGDNQKSINWRGKYGGEKKSYREGDFLILSDRNVYPEIFNNFYEIISSSEPAKLLRTPKSGYLYRRLANAMQDLKIEYDFTVRDAAGKLVQFAYGEDGIAVNKSEGGLLNVKKIINEVLEV